MPDFLDNLKKTWQEQEVTPKYDSPEILEMLNKSSRNYVKYIFWISVTEFVVFLGITIYYVFFGDDSQSFVNILKKLGVKKTLDLEASLAHTYFLMKIISLAATAFFVLRFYTNYKKIKVEANLKKFILQIMSFKKTVKVFIITNILLLIVFTTILTVFIFKNIHQQNIQLNNSTLMGFISGVLVATFLSVWLILIYYRVVYGIIMRRLSKNLEQLKEIEKAND